MTDQALAALAERLGMPLCDARYDENTAITCDLDHGHPGDHEGFVTVTWPRDDE